MRHKKCTVAGENRSSHLCNWNKSWGKRDLYEVEKQSNTNIMICKSDNLVEWLIDFCLKFGHILLKEDYSLNVRNNICHKRKTHVSVLSFGQLECLNRKQLLTVEVVRSRNVHPYQLNRISCITLAHVQHPRSTLCSREFQTTEWLTNWRRMNSATCIIVKTIGISENAASS